MWTGPWRIIEFITAIVVIVQHEKTRKKQTVAYMSIDWYLVITSMYR